MVYMDSAATSKPREDVINIMIQYMHDYWYNPSSLYNPSKIVKNKIDESKGVIADFINAKKNEIFFTSGASESNCWAIRGFVDKCLKDGYYPVVITTNIEHKSLLECTKNMIYAHVYIVGVDNYGFVDLNELEDVLKESSSLRDTKVLVSIQYANNEIGTIQNIHNISGLVHQYDGVFHTDATQAFGRILVDVNYDNIDMLSASGHKIGAPKGIGILYKKSDIKISPLIYGNQMDGIRGGTENVPGIVGFAEAVKSLNKYIVSNYYDMPSLNVYMIEKLCNTFGDKVRFNSPLRRLPNIINATFLYPITSEALIYLLETDGIYVSAGSACESISIGKSHVLDAIGLPDEDANRTIRFSLSENITRYDIDYVVEKLEEAIKVLSCQKDGGVVDGNI